jgi:hypothetical protein
MTDTETIPNQRARVPLFYCGTTPNNQPLPLHRLHILRPSQPVAWHEGHSSQSFSPVALSKTPLQPLRPQGKLANLIAATAPQCGQRASGVGRFSILE